MKRLALAVLLSGIALAGGGGYLPALDQLRPLQSLSGQAFDLAWLDEMRSQQAILAGIDELEIRYGKRAALKRWAAQDRKERLAAVQRLQAFKEQLEPPTTASNTDVVVAIANSTEKDFLARFDAFFLSESAKALAQSATLARLALGKSQNPALRHEAAALLEDEQGRLADFKTLN